MRWKLALGLHLGVLLAAVVVLLIRALGASFKAAAVATTVGPAEATLRSKLLARRGTAKVRTTVGPAVAEALGNVLTLWHEARG